MPSIAGMSDADLAYYLSGQFAASGAATSNSAVRAWANRGSALTSNFLQGLGLPRDQIENRTLDVSPGSYFQRVSPGDALLGGQGIPAMPSPFPFTGYQNPFGMLTLPNAFYPSGLLGFGMPGGTLPALPSQNVPQLPQSPAIDLPAIEIQPQQASASALLPCYLFGIGCGSDVPLGGFAESFHDLFKRIGIGLFALVLLAFGLYFLAKSTDTGKIAIGLAKKAAAA